MSLTNIAGDIKKDIDAKKLTNFLVESGVKKKACNMAIEWWTDKNGKTNTSKFELLVNKAESMRTIDEDNSEFKKELVFFNSFFNTCIFKYVNLIWQKRSQISY